MDIAETLNNITLTLGNTSYFVSECALMVENTYINSTYYIDKFATWNDYWLSFLMNLSGNVVNFFLISADL